MYSSSGSMTGCRCSASSHRLVDSDEHAGAVQRSQQLGLRVEARGRVAQRVAHPLAAVAQLRRCAAARGPLAERLGQDRVVGRGIPRQSRRAQLLRDQRAGRLGRREQAQPRRVGGAVDRRALPGELLQRTRRCRRAGRVADVVAVRDRTAPARCRTPRTNGAASHCVAARTGASASTTSAESRRIAWHSRRSWQRATRTPAASSVGVPRGRVAPHPARRSRQLGRARPSRSGRRRDAAQSGRAPRRRRPGGAAATPSSARPRTIQVAPVSPVHRRGPAGSSLGGPSTRWPRHPLACSRDGAPTRTRRRDPR